ncbi:hypothetical protein WA158_007292 [Blastocystis sp. Blastoise]
MEQSTSSSSASSLVDDTWIDWFCSLDGNEVLCNVDKAYIEDSFNLYGIKPYIQNFNECYELMMDLVHLTPEREEQITPSTVILYGLIHQRFALTEDGTYMIKKKFERKYFGVCPRYLCKEQPLLPMGISTEPSVDSMKLYCPLCQDVYVPQNRKHRYLDGCFFGPSLPYVVLLNLNPIYPPIPLKKYDMKIYGFRAHSSSAIYRKRIQDKEAKKQ